MDKPKYVQISESLADEIASGRYKPGDRLPSERMLSEQMGISRMTVRQAITTLINRGLAVRYQGKGTFISEIKIEQNTDMLISFHTAMEKRGFKPGAKVLSSERCSANQSLAATLQVGIGSALWYIHRLRTVNGEPHFFESTYIPESFCAGIDKFDLSRHSVYEIMDKEFGVQFDYAEQTYEPISANEYQTELLEVELGSPLMLVRRISYNVEGQVVEFAKDIFRGDRSRFSSRSVFKK